jgi:glycosyltransferase involved in cell wall biosynthesis
VVPHIQIKTCVVGRGFEDLKHELEREGKVQVIGAVESLAEWYRNAHFVIAPIFDGSGMKTKVAEALMYGKKIIGTPEAFSGYEEIVAYAGHSCSTPDDFISAINAADGMVKEPFDTELRAIYESRFSLAAARVRLREILAA